MPAGNPPSKCLEKCVGEGCYRHLSISVGRAFLLMYEATMLELTRFDFRNPPKEVQMVMVNPFGEIAYFVDF